MNKHEKNLKNITLSLDEVMGANGEIVKMGLEIINNDNESATLSLLKKISEVLDDDKQKIETKQLARFVHTSIIEYYGYKKIYDICNKNKYYEDSRTLEELLDELNSLIGLENVKTMVNNLIIYHKVQRMREEKNLNVVKNTLHLAFMGNPGTGKTTVARIVGRIYKKVGLLSKGHFIEVSRTDLIAGYQGQTALKVKKIIEQSIGGVLFIDEAYSITENDKSDSYGRECLTELTKALEDYRENLVVIVAGYTEPMQLFFDSNPGLKSRFNKFIEFPDYEVSELEEILISMCKSSDYILSENLILQIRQHLGQELSDKKKNFANARMIRNLYENLLMNHAKRVVNLEDLNQKELSLLIDKDFKYIDSI